MQRSHSLSTGWELDPASWSPLRALAFAKLFFVYGFLVFVVANGLLLTVAPSDGRLVEDSWRYILLSGGLSVGLSALVLVGDALNARRAMGRVLTVAGVGDRTIFEYVHVLPLTLAVALGAVSTTVCVAFAGGSLVGAFVLIAPIFVVLVDAVVASVLPLSGSVDPTRTRYRIDGSDHSYDLRNLSVVGAVELDGVTGFCVRRDAGPPLLLLLPTELYSTIPTGDDGRTPARPS